MGAVLADGFVQGQAASPDWRTTPLWGLHLRPRYLHDGRAASIGEAIQAHAGEATQVIAAFDALDAEARARLLAFVGGL